MKNLSLTQVELAERIGVTQAAVSKWLKGTVPKGDQLLAISRALGVTMEWLLTGQGEPTIGENIAAAEEWHGRSVDETERQHLITILQKRENQFQNSLSKGKPLKHDPFDVAVDTMDLRKQLKLTEARLRRLKKALAKLEAEDPDGQTPA